MAELGMRCLGPFEDFYLKIRCLTLRAPPNSLAVIDCSANLCPVQFPKMLRNTFLALVGLLLLQLAVTAQAPAKRESYDALLERVKKQDQTVSFFDLRMAYTETKAYAPYGGDKEARKAMFAALNAKQYELSVAASEKVLEANYLDLNAHFAAYVSHRELGHAEKSNFHKYVFQGLLKSINDSGDGKTMETAFVVISVDEEYVWFNYMGLRMANQSLVEDKGHHYDKMTATDPKTGQPVSFYFNIDKPWNWLGGSLKSKSNPGVSLGDPVKQ